MERERWKKVYEILDRLDTKEYRGVFCTAAILGVFFWAVIHDRPICWACKRTNWQPGLWRGRLPSQSTMSRRLKTPQVQSLLQAVSNDPQVTGDQLASCVKVVDAKPLPVGGHSRDPDSRWGRGGKTLLKGYKFYAIWGSGWMPLAWRVASMNTSESSMAQQMLPSLRGKEGYLLGDAAYDLNKLYDAATAVGQQLLAQRSRPGAALGHRRHSPARLRCIELFKTRFGQTVFMLRDAIERNFGGLTNFGGGLAPLPNWVRRSKRVHQWVHAKLIINAVRIHLRILKAVA